MAEVATLENPALEFRISLADNLTVNKLFFRKLLLIHAFQTILSKLSVNMLFLPCLKNSASLCI
jgi:hypothetical protein